MSVIPLSPAEVPTHLPLANACEGERHHALALRIADEIAALMFATPVPPKERQFVLGVAQFMAGARRTLPSKPGAMSATRAREVRERAPHAANHLLDAARAAGDKWCLTFEDFEISVDVENVAGIDRAELAEATRRHIIARLSDTTFSVGERLVSIGSAASMGPRA